MATEIREATQAQPLPDWEQLDHYEDWQRREGAPLITGFYIEDLKELELGAWERKGGKGAFVNLEGTGGVNDLQILEVPPSASTVAVHHMFEVLAYVVAWANSSTLCISASTVCCTTWPSGPRRRSIFCFSSAGWAPTMPGSVCMER